MTAPEMTLPARDYARTPPGVWRAPLALLDRPSYDVDVATDHLGGVTVPAHVRLTPEENSLDPDTCWGVAGDAVWCNPPFSRAGGGKLRWAHRALQAVHQQRIRVAFYGPVYGDLFGDLLESRATGTIRIGGGRVMHGEPPGVTYSSPMQTAHRIWLLGRWPSVRLVWNWKEEQWLI